MSPTASDTSSTASSTAPTPFPYVVGQVLNLKSSGEKDISVTITKVYPLTMSPVMEVQIQTEEGYEEAVLKLFDRRFGDSRKECGYSNDPPKPHTEQIEAAWKEYVRRGSVKALFDDIKRKEDLFDYEGICEDSESDDDQPEWEKLAEEEGKLQYKMERNYASEVQAYKQLQELQGRCVPRFISSVTFDMPSYEPDLPPTYFQVSGVLLQKICGFNLSDLISHLPKEAYLWEGIIQNAVDAATEVNRAGVFNRDAQPRNVIVAEVNGHDRKFQCFMIDFAQSSFRWEYKDTDDLDDWSGWKANISMRNNPGAIGCIMLGKIKRGTGIKLEVTYPDLW